MITKVGKKGKTRHQKRFDSTENKLDKYLAQTIKQRKSIDKVMVFINTQGVLI